MSHTEGRLETSDRYIVKGLQVIATCISAYGFVDSEANARRLVACWNACDGLPTDLLEQMVNPTSTYAALLKGRNDLVKERDELVAVIRSAQKAVEQGIKSDFSNILAKYKEAS